MEVVVLELAIEAETNLGMNSVLNLERALGCGQQARMVNLRLGDCDRVAVAKHRIARQPERSLVTRVPHG